MSIFTRRAEVLAGLAAFDSRGFGMGAMPLISDARDVPISELVEPGAAGPPEEFDLSHHVLGIYNQGDLPSCVAHSTAAMQSIFENIEHRRWFDMDAIECYRQNGGTGTEGVDTRQVLQWEQSVGMLAFTTRRRYRIGSYAFADPQTHHGRQAIKTALAASCPCVLAMLLPDDFWSGDCYSDVITNGYHQVCLVGYDSQRVKFVNSWGVEYGNAGFGSVSWEFIERPEQQYFVYAFTAIDQIDPQSRPRWSLIDE